MKVTLHDDLKSRDGVEFERDAELRSPKEGEYYIYFTLTEKRINRATFDYLEDRYIVLTPKKKKYWRLDPVNTFAEATKFNEWGDIRYGKHSDEQLPKWIGNTNNPDVQWLRLTEHEE